MVPLNVDVEPHILPDGKVRLRLGLQYVGSDGGARTARERQDGEPDRAVPGPATRTELRQNLWLVLESGKPLVAAQSADPVSDRQVTIEVRATIQR